MATSSMENGDLELGEVDMMIQQRVQSLLGFVEENHTKPFSPFIYIVPPILRDLSPISFNRQLVSIGALHRDDNNVQASEGLKASYLSNLMSRIDSSREEILKSCMQKVDASMNKVKACYVWPKKTYSDAEVAEMMVMDACFILEFLYPAYDEKVRLRSSLLVDMVTRDLILLENQIPFFILNDIFQCTILKFDPQATLVGITLPLLFGLNIFSTDYVKINNISIDNTHHILSLLHQCYKPQDNIVPTPISESTINIPSVVDLDTAGVNIRPNQDSTWMIGMQVKLHRFPCFCGLPCKATLRMPKLDVEDRTELVLRNLIAYEQLGFSTSNHMTSYVFFIDNLVNTKEDITKLVDSGVLFNYLGSNEEAVNMINNIGKQVLREDYFYTEQCKTLNEHYNRYWPKNIARLRRTYFNSPLSIIALLAGIILFALTMVRPSLPLSLLEAKSRFLP